MLDDDESSEACKRQYIEDHLLENDQVMTFENIDNSFKGMRFENLISADDKRKLFDKFMPQDNRPADKKALARILQELVAKQEKFQFDQTAMKNMRMVFSVLQRRMTAMQSAQVQKAA